MCFMVPPPPPEVEVVDRVPSIAHEGYDWVLWYKDGLPRPLTLVMQGEDPE